MKKTVCELFAGVGGFRVGLEAAGEWETVLANQWEPSRKAQDAAECYQRNFGEVANLINDDINKLNKDEFPDFTLLVGGFPCQNYSVAATGAKGIEGEKGVLWWDIYQTIKAKQPPFILLENVDRLLKSPTAQRGRDFGIMLRTLHDLGYGVEWRVINAADYGYAQKRRRTFIFGFHQSTKFYGKMQAETLVNIVKTEGVFATQFPINLEERSKHKPQEYNLLDGYEDIVSVSDNFAATFLNSGVMMNGSIYTREIIPARETPVTLGEILETEAVDEKYFLGENLEKWQYLKGAKRINRVKPNGEPYVYSEGGMAFPDHLDQPGRTMLTSESSINRSTHVVIDKVTGKLRLITPVEAERLNGFPDNWTSGMTDRMRYFCMGNALVVPIITRFAQRLNEIVENEA
ncbi:MAG: DNA (cytosine-5-)-methyltransferase [Culicoidibacterales bacterium]